MRLRVLAGFALVALAISLPETTHAQLTRGSIAGTVRDPQGASVPGATVTVTNTDTNISRTTVTDSQGFYRAGALEPGHYNVLTALSGFAPLENKDIQVRAATEVTVNLALKLAGVGEALTVTAQAEAVELNKSNPTIGMTTSQRQVAELPLGGAARNINSLVLLTANAVSTTGQGTYTINGQRSRNNNFMIDGSDNNDISVTIATSQIVPEAVAEFQVQTNAYSVEFGRNSGGQINVITKSGSNRFRGEAWEYYQTNGWSSLTNVEKLNGLTTPSRFIRHQFGGDLGGPIVKDKTFFFLLYQQEFQRPGSTLGATTRMLTPAGFAALQSVPLGAGQTTASRQAVIQKLGFLQDIYPGLSFRNLQNTLVNSVNIETGQANVSIVSPSTYKTFLGRLDHRLGNRDMATVRYSYNGRIDENAISNCAFGALFCGKQDLKDTNLAASETHTFSSSLLNEFRFSLVRRNLDFPENDPKSPSATITGLFTIGGASNFPQFRVSNTYQFSDTLTWTRGRHNLKFGADVRYNKLDNFSAFDSKGTFTFNNLQDYMNNISNAAYALQTSSFLAKQWQNGLFVQDDFRLKPDLVLNLGLRYELSDIPLGFFGATDTQSLGALVPQPMTKDKNNFAPRIGFAWSPRSGGFLRDGKTVFRGGFGIGYDILFYNLLVVNASNYPRVVTLNQNAVQNLYPSLPAGSAVAVFDPLAAFTNSNPNTQNPAARFYSFSVQREIKSFILEVGYAGSHSYHGINQQQANPAVLTPAQIATVLATRNSNSIPNVQARRLFPQDGSRVLIPSDVGPNGVDGEARGKYDALIVALTKRMSHGLQFNANYTHSRNMSNNDASLGEGGTDGSSQRPQDYFNMASEWSVSQFDRPHRFVVNYIWEIPGPKSGVLKQILGGWQVSGVTQAQSGRPFTIVTGVDSNGDGNTGSDRPNIDPNGTFTWDKERKGFTNSGYYTAPLGTNNLPLANSLGNGNAARNGERSAGFWNTDLSVMKRFNIGKRQLQVRGDMFNAFNQDSYGVPVVSMTSLSFGQNTNNWGRRTATVSGKFIW